MGTKVTLIADPRGDYIDEDTSGIHACGINSGDAGTLCGMHFVDGLTPKETNRAVTCKTCISELEHREIYTKRSNGKWY